MFAEDINNFDTLKPTMSSVPSPAAQKDAENLLKSFRNSRGTKYSPHDSPEGQYYADRLTSADAATQGSALREAYSDEKKRLPFFGSPETTMTTRSTTTNNNTETLSIVRKALFELQRLDKTEDNTSNGLRERTQHISNLLQGVEDRLTTTSNHDEKFSHTASRIAFSPTMTAMEGEESSTSTSAMKLRSRSSRGHENSVLKVYMKNQLELQEAEWESYEETVNSLAEQLEQRDDELQVVKKERDELVEAVETSSSQVIQLEARLKDLESNLSMELENKLSSNASVHTETEKIIQSMETEIASLQLQLNTSDMKIREYDDEVERMEQLVEERDTRILELETRVSHLSNSTSTRSTAFSGGEDSMAVVEVYESKIIELNNVIEELRGEIFFKDTVIQSRGMEIESKHIELMRTQDLLHMRTRELQDIQDRLVELEDTIQNSSQVILPQIALANDCETVSQEIMTATNFMDNQIDQFYSEITSKLSVFDIRLNYAIDNIRYLKPSIKQDLMTNNMNTENATSSATASSTWNVDELIEVKSIDSEDFQDVNLMREREKQMKSMIIELQNQQDIIAQLNGSHIILTEQNQKLRDVLEESRARESDLYNELTVVRTSLHTEQMSVKDLQLELQAMKQKTRDLGQQLDDALTENIRKQNTNINISTSMITPNKRSSSSGGNGGMDTPSRTPLQDARLEQLSAQLTQAMQERDDLQISLESRLSHKTQRVEELSSEVGRYRALLTAKTDEFDANQSQNMLDMAKLQAQLIENERSCMSLKALVEMLENGRKEAEAAIQEKVAELQREKETNDWYKDIVKKLTERSDAINNISINGNGNGIGNIDTDRIVSFRSDESSPRNFVRIYDEVQVQVEEDRIINENLQDEVKDLRSRLNEAQSTISHLRRTDRQQQQHPQRDNSNSAATTMSIIEQQDMQLLQYRIEEAEKVISTMEKERMVMDQEMAALRAQIVVNGDAQTSTAIVRNRMERDKTKLESAVQQLKDKNESQQRILEQRTVELMQVKDCLRTIAQETLAARARLTNQEDLLVSQISSWFALFDEKLNTASWTLHQISTHEVITGITSSQNDIVLFKQELVRRSENWAVEKEELERELSENKLALRNASIRVDKAVESENKTFQELRETRRILEQQQQLINNPIVSRDNNNNDMGMGRFTPENWPRLLDKLENAEKSARSIAYLEGECSRLKHLVDHLRIVNTKLTGDVTAALSEGIEVRSLQHRLKVTVQAVHDEKIRVQSLENQLRNKEKDMVTALDAAQEHEEQRAEKYEHDIKGLTSKLRISQDKAVVLTKEIEVSRLEFDQIKEKLLEEINSLNLRINTTESDIEAEKRYSAETETVLSSLRSNLVQKEQQIIELNELSQQQQQRYRVKMDEWKDRREALEVEVQEKTTHVLNIENIINSMKIQMEKLEDEIISRDNTITSNKSQIHENDELITKLRQQLSATQSESNFGVRQKDELELQVASQRAEIESLKLNIEEVKTVLASTSSKLVKAEERVRELMVDNEISEKRVVTARSEQNLLRNSLAEAETKTHELTDQLSYTRVTLKAAEDEALGLQDENANLRKQLDENTRELNNTLRKNNTYTAEISELQDEVEALRTNYSEMDEALRCREGELSDVNVMITALIHEIKSHLSILVHIKERDDLLASPYKGTIDLDESNDNDHNHNIDTHDNNNDSNTATNTNTNRQIITNDEIQCKERMHQLRHLVDSLKDKTEGYSSQTHDLTDTLRKLRTDLVESRRREDSAEQKSRVLQIEREALISRLETANEDIVVLQEQLTVLSSHKENIAHSIEEQSIKLRSIRRAILSMLSSDAGGGSSSGKGKMNSSFISQGLDDSRTVDTLNSSLISVVRDLEVAIPQLEVRLDALYSDDSTKLMSLDRLQAEMAEKESIWNIEKMSLIDRITTITSELDDECSVHTQTRCDLENAFLECEELRQGISEYSRNNSDLESELRCATDNNTELRSALNEAEALCLDLRSRIKNLQVEVDHKSDDVQHMREQLDIHRRKISELELELEKSLASLGRLRAEKDGLDNIRKSLEIELENSRTDLLSNLSKGSNLQESSSFDLERILSALGGTIEHWCAVFAPTALEMKNEEHGTSNTSSTSSNFKSFEFTSTMISKLRISDNTSESISTRVEIAIKKLNELRAWSRDERRYRQMLEERCTIAERELEYKTANLEEIQRDLKKHQFDITDKDRELRERTREHNDLISDITRRQDEIERLRQEIHDMSNQIDEERRHRMKFSGEVLNKDTELSSALTELETQSNLIQKLQESNTSLKDQLTDTKSESEMKGEQLRAAKATISRLNESIDRLDKGVDKGKKERDELEAKLQEIDTLSTSMTRLRAQYTESELKLVRTEESRRSLADAKQILEDKFERLQVESEHDKHRLLLLEDQYNAIGRENVIIDTDLKEMRSELSKTRERLEFEYAARMKAENSLESYRRSTEEWRDHGENAVAARDAIEEKYAQMEVDNKSLRDLVNALRISNDEREVLLQSESEGRRRAEQDAQIRNTALDRAQRELTKTTTRASTLRQECRRVRRLVIEAAAQIRELVNVVRSDAMAAGVELANTTSTSSVQMTPNNKHYEILDKDNATGAGNDDNELLTGGDVLGMNELNTALDSIRGVLAWIQEMPRERLDLESQVRRLEVENIRILRELKTSESMNEDMITSMRAENQQLERQLAEARAMDGGRGGQLGALERTLAFERDERVLAQTQCRELNKKIEMLNVELQDVMKSSRGDGYNQANMNEIEHLRKEITTLRQEVRAVSHHRSVLREAIDQMEAQLKRRAETYNTNTNNTNTELTLGLRSSSPLPMSMRGGSGGGGGGGGGMFGLEPKQQLDESMTSGRAPDINSDDDILRKQVARFRARSSAMETLVGIYRSGIIALYPDGSSYGLAQFENLERSETGLNTGWAESEVNAIRRSFEEETQLLESEVEELRGRLKQGASYISELRKRLEESLRANYKSSKGQISEALNRQLEHLASSLDQSQTETRRLSNDLATERTMARKRHMSLIDEISRATQTRDLTLAALHKLEAKCREMGIDYTSTYQTLSRDIQLNKSSYGNINTNTLSNNTNNNNMNNINMFDRNTLEKDIRENIEKDDQMRVIDTLRRAVLETDEELEVERRARRRNKTTTTTTNTTTNANTTNTTGYNANTVGIEPLTTTTTVSGTSTSGGVGGGGGNSAIFTATTTSSTTNRMSSMLSQSQSQSMPVSIPSTTTTATSETLRDTNTHTNTRNVISMRSQGQGLGSGSLRVARAGDINTDNSTTGGGGSGKTRLTTKIMEHRTTAVEERVLRTNSSGSGATGTSIGAGIGGSGAIGIGSSTTAYGAGNMGTVVGSSGFFMENTNAATTASTTTTGQSYGQGGYGYGIGSGLVLGQVPSSSMLLSRDVGLSLSRPQSASTTGRPSATHRTSSGTGRE
eukprot:gene2275-4425_t